MVLCTLRDPSSGNIRIYIFFFGQTPTKSPLIFFHGKPILVKKCVFLMIIYHFPNLPNRLVAMETIWRRKIISKFKNAVLKEHEKDSTQVTWLIFFAKCRKSIGEISKKRDLGLMCQWHIHLVGYIFHR